MDAPPIRQPELSNHAIERYQQRIAAKAPIYEIEAACKRSKYLHRHSSLMRRQVRHDPITGAVFLCRRQRVITVVTWDMLRHPKELV